MSEMFKSHKVLGTSDQRFNKALCAYVVFIFDRLEHDMGLKTNASLKKATRLSSATLYKVRKMAENGQLTNKRQIRTIQRLAEVAGIQPFNIPIE